MLVAVAVADGAFIVASLSGAGMLGTVVTPGDVLVLAGNHAAFTGVWLLLYIVMLIAVFVSDGRLPVTAFSGTGMFRAEVASGGAFLTAGYHAADIGCSVDGHA